VEKIDDRVAAGGRLAVGGRELDDDPRRGGKVGRGDEPRLETRLGDGRRCGEEERERDRGKDRRWLQEGLRRGL
jgi:hypothetical protein